MNLRIIFSLFNTACISFTDSHQQFLHNMNYKIGKPFQESTTLRKDYKGKTVLENGNHEHGYAMFSRAGKCDIYEEVDPNTNIVVAWRFEVQNTVYDCIINQ